jgi:hypothetical protein
LVDIALLVSGTANEEIAAAPNSTTLPPLGSGHCRVVLAMLRRAFLATVSLREGISIVHLQKLQLNGHITINSTGK